MQTPDQDWMGEGHSLPFAAMSVSARSPLPVLWQA